MKISSGTELPAILSSRALSSAPDSDLLSKGIARRTPRVRTRNPSFSGIGARRRRDGAPLGRRSRPETPLLKWKFDDKDKGVPVKEEKPPLPESGLKSRRKVRRDPEVLVSARKLAAGLWRLHSPESVANGGGNGGGWKGEHGLDFQPGVGHGGLPFICHRNSQANNSEAKDLIPSPLPFSFTKNGFLHKPEPSFQFTNSAMEGTTKWDPICSKTSDEVYKIYSQMELLNRKVSAAPMVSVLQSELEQSQARIQELEAERQSSKKKYEHFMTKLSEEKASWRNREHEKIRAVIDDAKADLNRERKNRQRMELVNAKLVNELADTKQSAKRFMQDYEKERKARELIEEVCDELAKEIGEDKAEVEALKRESFKLREEVDEERKMLQMAEVWREERVQMKLIDAKVALEEKYTQMIGLISGLKTFLKSRSATPSEKEMKEADLLLQAAASVNIQDIKEFSYEPPNPDDIFSVLDEVNLGESNEREIETCAYSPASHASKIRTVSPEINGLNKNSSQRHSTAFLDNNDDIEEDESGWETVCHPEDQGSSYSPEGSDPSVNKVGQSSNVSGSGTEWDENVGGETPITDISEVCSVPARQSKKSSISRLWRSCPNNAQNYKIISVEGMNGRLSSGRISNGSINSPDRGSGNGRFSPSDFVGQWSSPDSDPQINKAMKGCIEWPRGMQKSSLKAKLLEARTEKQKIQLRHVLKQKI